MIDQKAKSWMVIIALSSAIFIIGVFIFKFDFVIALFLALNLSSFIVFGYDKSAARSGGIRIPESVFLLLALLGASPLILLGMLLFRHKIRDRTFLPKLVVIIVFQLFAAVLFLPKIY